MHRSLAVSITAVALLSAPAVTSADGIAARPATRPAVISRTVIGHSVRGRRIVAYRLGNRHSRITAVLVGQMHGNEHAGVKVARAVLRAHAVRHIDLWVIPTMNPDGNARDTRGNARGVDLNRNWPYHWTHLTGHYDSGRRPLSEPETRAVHRFLLRVRPRYLVSIHQPLDGVDTTDGGARDPAFRRRLARNLHLPQKPFRCWSTCHGNMTGWLTGHERGAAITVEFPAHPSRHALRVRAPRGIVAAFRGQLVER